MRKIREGVFRVNTHSVVLDGESPFLSLLFCRNVDVRRFFATILNRVANEILQELTHLRRISHHSW